MRYLIALFMSKIKFFFLLSFCLFIFFYLLPSNQPDLTIVGYAERKDGIGRHSTEIIDLFGGKFNLNFVLTRKDKKVQIPNKYKRLICKKKCKWGKIILFEDMLWRPGKEYYKKILSSNRDKSIRIAYSVWESSALPDQWVEILNTHFDACIVPSSFLIDVYYSSGVKIPIFLLPLGLDFASLKVISKNLTVEKPFTFGNLSACSERKNQVLLIRAFSKAFGNDPSVLLRINSRYGEESIKKAILEEISVQKLDNVIFTYGPLSQTEYAELFRTIDCYVSPSKGEGYSIQPREALVLGIPVIATNNTGQQDLCSSQYVYPLETPIKERAIFPWGDCYGEYYNCHIQDLVEALVSVKESYSVYRDKALKGSEWVKQFDSKSLESRYSSFIKPEKIVKSEKNEILLSEIHIASDALLEKYQKLFH